MTSSSTPATITDTYSYTAFGESFATTGTTVNPYRYTGQQFDSATGLYSLRARFYSPTLRRFLSQDTYPFDFGNPIEFNRYSYTANNPTNTIDPSGKFALETALTTNTVTRQNAEKAALMGQLTKSIYIGVVLAVLLLPVGVFVGELIGLDALAGDLVGGWLEDTVNPTDDTLVNDPTTRILDKYDEAKNAQDALNLITAAAAALAAQKAGLKILYRGTSLDNALLEQSNQAARYDGKAGRLWVAEDVIAAIWWAEYNTIVEEKQMGAISVYALPKTIWDTQRGGPEAGIWRRGPNDFGIRIELDPELIGPIVIAIPRAELRKIK